MKKLLLAVAAVVAMAIGAKAEWTKSYDWDDSKDQTWTAYDKGGKHYISTGGWEIEYSVVNGNEITIVYVPTVGTANLLNFDTVERDTGLKLVKIGSQKFKNKWSGFATFDLVFPASLAEIESEAFHTCPFDGDLVFPGRITLRNAVFYNTKAKTVTIKTPGSILDGASFGCGTGWSGTSDITGVTSIGNGSFQRGGSGYPVFEVVISAAVTNIGSQAFYQQRGVTLTVRPPTVIADIPDVDGVVAAKSFSDVGASLAQGFTLTIPYRGGCTVGSQAFNWMTKCGNFEFWGKAPVFANDAFNSITANYAARITGCVEMDPVGWTALATPCTDDEKSKANYPGDDVCLGIYTSGTGCKFWVCNGKSPYTASADAPVLDGVSVVRTSAGFRIAGSLIQGSANIAAHFGDLVFPLTDGKVSSPAQFDVELTVGDGQGQIPAGETYEVSVVADDGSEQFEWTAQDPVYTGTVSIQMIKAASEVGFEAGVFRISRVDANAVGEVEVSYATSGTAVAGKNYEALTGKVTIPDGAESVDVEIRPIYDPENDDGTTLVLTLTSGNYFISTTVGAAEMLIASSSVSLLNIYVDALAGEGGDGSESSPYKTIKEGVQSCAANGTVHVKGGDDRIYEIASLDDFVTFSRSGISVEPWIAGERVKIVLARGLHKLDANPKVFTISAGADNVKVSGLDLLLYGGGNTPDNYSILGDNEASAVFLVAGNGATFDDCSFEIDGSCNEGRGGYMVRTTAEQSSTQPGQNITVKNCRFANLGEYVFRSGLNPSFIGNSVTNCARFVYPLKAAWCDFTFVSNRLVNCGTFKTTVPNWQELQKGVFAYNIFVTENDTPFITKGAHGLTEAEVYIHHNTVIGGPLIFVQNTATLNKVWMPQIFDNVVVSSDGYVIKEDGAAFLAGNYSSFKTDGGAFFRNNAYSAAALNGGTATEVSGYDLSKGLLIENNVVLTELPKFRNTTDMMSSDYYRPEVKSKTDPLMVGGWTDSGAYPAYIGAVQPYVAVPGLLIYVR